ncbi:unnamed protein product [Leptidea sinapis]|nr:unnamed protein product [Leptidea sinapis]
MRRTTTNKSNNLAEEKVKVLEDEIAELRKKLIEKERDCERLHAELSLTQKKPKGSLIKSKSLDGDQQNVDLKRQLQVIEQEANVLRTKTQNLEADNEKLQAENKRLQLLKNTKSLKIDKSLEISSNKVSQLENDLKDALAKIKDLENKDDRNEKKVRFSNEITKKDEESIKAKQDELDKLKLNFSKLEKEKLKLQTSLKELKDEAIKSFKPRTPKKITDLTTKLQMKRMVEDLENEIGELYVIMKNAGYSTADLDIKSQMTKDIEDIKNKLSKKDSDFTNEKNHLQTEISKLKDLNTKLESEKKILLEKIKKLESGNNSSLIECKTLKEEKIKLETQINKITAELNKFDTQQTAVADCMKKIEDLKKEMDCKDKEINKLKKQVETNTKLEQEKNKLLKEVTEKTKKIAELEKKLKEIEEKCKKSEKLLNSRKAVVSKLEKEEDALRETSNLKYDEAVSSIELKQLQDKLQNSNKKLQEKEAELAAAKQELENVQKQLTVLQSEVTNTKNALNKAENDKNDAEKKLETEKKDSKYWESKASDFESDLQAERKKIERMRISHDKDNKNKEVELATLKGKLKILEQTSGAGAKRITELKQEFEDKMKALEHTIAVEKSEYEELTSKYELLEEEHVVTKARLTVEKEQAQGDLLHVKKELSAALTELQAVKQNQDTKSKEWQSEKTELQKEISSLQERLCGGGWEVEKARLKTKLDKYEYQLRDTIEKYDVLSHHHELAKKELEEAKKKLEDYERVSKVQRTLASDNAELEREMATLNNRLEQMEKARKNELTETKMRYEAQMNTMREELKSLHNQVSRFKRERDNYKQMLDAAQQSMAEIKNGNKPRSVRSSVSSTDDEEVRNKVATLEQQVACLEDELCESRMLASKLNTELISERSSTEYEEDRLLSSGRARVAGMATRMELAWHKERDEQQRLLQETSTLARDLRQTLFENFNDDDRVITQLLETIDDLIKQRPNLFKSETPIKPEKTLATPTPPRRNRSSKSRSRSATPEQAAAETSVTSTGARLRRLADELRAAMSTEPREAMTVTSRTTTRAPSLKKRSISLEQTTKEQSSIWKSVDESSVSSMQSLDGDDRLFTMQRDPSLDSRLSGGSAQSEVLPTEKTKKKSFFGKLKKLTKARSVDNNVDSQVADFTSIGSISQKDLRGRLTNMFSRKGQVSRAKRKVLTKAHRAHRGRFFGI